MLQTFRHLLVGGLGEVEIELAYRKEGFRCLGDYQIVDVERQAPFHVPGANRAGHHNTGCSESTGGLCCGSGGGSSGDPIVHDDRCSTGQRHSRVSPPEALDASLQLLPVPPLDLGELCGRDASQ